MVYSSDSKVWSPDQQCLPVGNLIEKQIPNPKPRGTDLQSSGLWDSGPAVCVSPALPRILVCANVKSTGLENSFVHNPGSRISLLNQAGRLVEDSQNLASDRFKFKTLVCH